MLLHCIFRLIGIFHIKLESVRQKRIAPELYTGHQSDVHIHAECSATLFTVFLCKFALIKYAMDMRCAKFYPCAII